MRGLVVGVQVAGSASAAWKLTGVVKVDVHVWVLGEVEGGGRAGEATADNADAEVGHALLRRRGEGCGLLGWTPSDHR